MISFQSKKTTKNEHKQVCVEDDIKLTVHLNYKDSLISDGQQFHKCQQNKQSPLTLIIEHDKDKDTWNSRF